MKSVCMSILLLCIASPLAGAHDDGSHKSKALESAAPAGEKAFGRVGDPKKVARTVRIEMADSMRYSPAEVAIKRGETVRFEATNSGKLMHEIVLGTMQDLKAHAESMKKHPGMEHGEPHMAHVAPGRTERVVWQFTKPGEFFYACLVPGHLEAGMLGRIVVR